MGADARERMHESGCTRADARADARVDARADARADARERILGSGYYFSTSDWLRQVTWHESGCKSGCKSGCGSGFSGADASALVPCDLS